MHRTLLHEKQGIMLECRQTRAGSIDPPLVEIHPCQLKSVSNLLNDYQDLFDLLACLAPIRDKDHAIILKVDTSPIYVWPYRYPHVQKNEIVWLVKGMLAAGIIRPSTSPFSSHVLFVKKKDGSWFFCVDYRALHRAMVPNKFPIPVIEELLDELHGAVIFSKIDLKSGYFQIQVRCEDIPKTTFHTHQGHYELLVMPFGLTNTPSTFQALMNDVFQFFLRKFVLVFFDDILVYGRSVEEHLEHLCQAFTALRSHKLFANSKKSLFSQPRIEYLGHIIDAMGVSADPAKIQTLVDWPTPTSLKAVRGFLGLTGYYRRFVQDYSKVAWPLTQLLQKDSFNWNVTFE